MPKGRADTVESLVDATLRLIARDGVEQVTLREIAREAGFTTGAIMQHFSGREALLAAAYERATDVSLDAIDIGAPTHEVVAAHAGEYAEARVLIRLDSVLAGGAGPVLAAAIAAADERWRARISPAADALDADLASAVAEGLSLHRLVRGAPPGGRRRARLLGVLLP